MTGIFCINPAGGWMKQVLKTVLQILKTSLICNIIFLYFILNINLLWCFDIFCSQINF